MNHLDLTRTILALADFEPPEGIDYAVILRPQPGICRVAVGFKVFDDAPTDYVELTEPPTEDTLRTLYRHAEQLLNQAWDSTIQPGPAWAAGLGLDMTRVGDG